MSVEIFSNEDGAVFVCNTSDWAFGPKMPGHNVAEAFLAYLTKDARLYEDAELSAQWTEFQQTRMSCPFGHYMMADVDTYDSGTVFTCMEKGCSAVWDIDGRIIDEDREYEEEQTARAEMFYDRCRYTYDADDLEDLRDEAATH